MKALKAIRLRGDKSFAFDTFGHSGSAGPRWNRQGFFIPQGELQAKGTMNEAIPRLTLAQLPGLPGYTVLRWCVRSPDSISKQVIPCA